MKILLEARSTANSARFHATMAAGCCFFVFVAAIGGRISPSLMGAARDVGFVFLLSIPAIYLYAGGMREQSDAALALSWAAMLAVIMPAAGPAFGEAPFPLRDADLTRFGRALHMHVPEIVAWTASHTWALLSSALAYESLPWLLLAAAFLPPVFWQRRAAHRFVLSNLIAFLIGLPVFAVMPAIGPWVGYGFRANAIQVYCANSILAFRAGRPTTFVGIVTFPSYHTIWAVLAAAALWPFRRLRIPAALLAGLIVISTITTGWHYVADVLAGLVIAGVALVLADRYVRTSELDEVGAPRSQPSHVRQHAKHKQGTRVMNHRNVSRQKLMPRS